MRKAIQNLNLQLPFRDRLIRRNSFFVNALPREESAIRLLGFALAMLVFVYVTFVSLTIVNVIARKEAGDQATALRAVVGQLERDYFAFSDGVTEDNGSALGLSPVSDTDFVYRPGAVGVVPNVRNEI